MLEQFIEFLNKYFGQANTGDTPQNQGQCVGLIEVWLDILKKPHIWGNAVDLLKNAEADTEHYEVILNDPNDYNQFPPVGAILVFDKSWGGGFGHCGVVVRANGYTFSLFEQNNPVGARPTITNYSNYAGVAGWIIVK